MLILNFFYPGFRFMVKMDGKIKEKESIVVKGKSTNSLRGKTLSDRAVNPGELGL